jgi:hypothetical protein
MVCYLFFNFAGLFDFGCCSLAQEKSFVDCYLPYFRQWLINHLLLAILPFQHLFTENLVGDQLLVPPPFSGALSVSCPLCCVIVFSLLIIQFFCFLGFFFVEASVFTRGYAGLTQGWLGEYHVTLSTCKFYLLNVSQAGLKLASGSGGSPPVFSVLQV